MIMFVSGWLAPDFGYRKSYRLFLDLYRYASAKLRGGDLSAVFPDNCFRPSLAYQPWSLGEAFS